jgi:hypothetical protein
MSRPPCCLCLGHFVVGLLLTACGGTVAGTGDAGATDGRTGTRADARTADSTREPDARTSLDASIFDAISPDGECPHAPADDMECATAGQTCNYAATQCNCEPGENGVSLLWVCDACPAAQPDNLTACTLQGEMCLYDDGAAACSCLSGVGHPVWSCDVSCPATQPEAGTSCNIASPQSCMYGNTTCLCMGQLVFYCN